MSANMFKKTLFSRIVAGWILVSFVCTAVIPPRALAQPLNLPLPGTMVLPTPAFSPVMIKGLKVHPENPLLFDFILDIGKLGLKVDGPDFKAESQKLIKYFLAALTIKEDDLWVNLSPYEKDRILPEELGKTELGRDMLAQDYILKQLTSSLMYPEKELGKAFWTKIYAKAQEQFGTSDIPVDTFNKVWIMADKARVLERNNAAFVTGAHLKVMLESDYVAANQRAEPPVLPSGRRDGGGVPNPLKGPGPVNSAKAAQRAAQVQPPAASGTGATTPAQELSKQIIREVIIPAIEKEVNEGRNFAPLRQMFSSMILATWYKVALKDALLNQVYTDKGKTGGVLSDDPAMKDKIYAQYLEAYKKGVFNYIKEDMDAVSQQAVPRKYFSGGFSENLWIGKVFGRDSYNAAQAGSIQGNFAQTTVELHGMRVDAVSVTPQDSTLIPTDDLTIGNAREKFLKALSNEVSSIVLDKNNRNDVTIDKHRKNIGRLANGFKDFIAQQAERVSMQEVRSFVNGVFTDVMNYQHALSVAPASRLSAVLVFEFITELDGGISGVRYKENGRWFSVSVRKRFVTKEKLDKTLIPGLFDWLMKQGYFYEKAGETGTPRLLTGDKKDRLKKKYELEFNKILTFLRKVQTDAECFRESNSVWKEIEEMAVNSTINSALRRQEYEKEMKLWVDRLPSGRQQVALEKKKEMLSRIAQEGVVQFAAQQWLAAWLVNEGFYMEDDAGILAVELLNDGMLEVNTKGKKAYHKEGSDWIIEFELKAPAVETGTGNSEDVDIMQTKLVKLLGKLEGSLFTVMNDESIGPGNQMEGRFISFRVKKDFYQLAVTVNSPKKWIKISVVRQMKNMGWSKNGEAMINLSSLSNQLFRETVASLSEPGMTPGDLFRWVEGRLKGRGKDASMISQVEMLQIIAQKTMTDDYSYKEGFRTITLGGREYFINIAYEAFSLSSRIELTGNGSAAKVLFRLYVDGDVTNKVKYPWPEIQKMMKDAAQAGRIKGNFVQTTEQKGAGDGALMTPSEAAPEGPGSAMNRILGILRIINQGISEDKEVLGFRTLDFNDGMHHIDIYYDTGSRISTIQLISSDEKTVLFEINIRGDFTERQKKHKSVIQGLMRGAVLAQEFVDYGIEIKVDIGDQAVIALRKRVLKWLYNRVELRGKDVVDKSVEMFKWIVPVKAESGKWRFDFQHQDSAETGGIDLNAKNMSMDVAKDGQGIEMTFDPAMAAEFRKGNFTGLEGIILRIIPIQNPLLILGFETTPPQGKSAHG